MGYHHATIGVVWGFMLSTGHGNGTVRYGAMINSVTHVLMYSHYLWTSFGLKNPLKNMLTMWQITQFYSCFVHAISVLFLFPQLEVSLPIKLAWLQFGYHITMIYLSRSSCTGCPSGSSARSPPRRRRRPKPRATTSGGDGKWARANCYAGSSSPNIRKDTQSSF